MWLEGGSDAKGRSLSASGREGVLVFRSERKKEKLRRENKIVFGEWSLRSARVSKRANEREKGFSVWK